MDEDGPPLPIPDSSHDHSADYEEAHELHYDQMDDVVGDHPDLDEGQHLVSEEELRLLSAGVIQRLRTRIALAGMPGRA